MVDQNNVVKSRLITIKQKLPNIYVIESGLAPTDKIIYEGVQSAKEDEKINITTISAKEALSIK